MDASVRDAKVLSGSEKLIDAVVFCGDKYFHCRKCSQLTLDPNMKTALIDNSLKRKTSGRN